MSQLYQDTITSLAILWCRGNNGFDNNEATIYGALVNPACL